MNTQILWFQAARADPITACLISLLRLLQRGTISEEVYAEFTANIDELLRSPSTMDWILAAELRDRSEQPPAGEPAAGA